MTSQDAWSFKHYFFFFLISHTTKKSKEKRSAALSHVLSLYRSYNEISHNSDYSKIKPWLLPNGCCPRENCYADHKTNTPVPHKLFLLQRGIICTVFTCKYYSSGIRNICNIQIPYVKQQNVNIYLMCWHSEHWSRASWVKVINTLDLNNVTDSTF